MRGDIPSVGTVSTLRFGLIFLYFFPVAVGGQRRGYDNRVYGQQQYWGQPGNRGVSPHSAFISPQFHSLTKLGREKRDGERWANPQRQKGKHWFLPVLVVGFNWEGTLVPKINGRGVQPFPPGDTPPPPCSVFCPPPQGYRNFYDRYRGDYDRFYGRDYDYNRYRDYYRQYNREVTSFLVFFTFNYEQAAAGQRFVFPEIPI